MLIGFTHKTSKILPKIFCKKFKHCAVIFDLDKEYIFVQIGKDGIRIIQIGNKEIKLLESSGWFFIKIKQEPITRNTNLKIHLPNMLTCVGFAKKSLCIYKPFIWTPDQLYNYLIKNQK